MQKSTYAQLECVRACVRHAGKNTTPYLVSPRAEILYVYIISINDGTRILTPPGINNNGDSGRHEFLRGIDWFKFWIALIPISRSISIVTVTPRNISVGYSQRCLCLGCFCAEWECLLHGIVQFENMFLVLSAEESKWCKFNRMQNMIFWFLDFCCTRDKSLWIFKFKCEFNVRPEYLLNFMLSQYAN